MAVADAPHTEDRFRLAMQSAGIGMAITALDGTFLEVNPALCRMLDCPAEALLGRSVHEVTHRDDQRQTDALFQRLLSQQDDALDAEKRYLRPDGSIVEVLVNAAVMRDGAGRPSYFIAQLRDISAQRAAERELIALNASLEDRVQARTEELEAANRRLEAFANGVAHDLRAPLRSIDGFAGQLARRAEGRLEPESMACLDRIRSASKSMASLIDGLHELARVSAAQLRPARVDLSLLADWAAAELQNAEPGRAADIRVAQGLEVIGDERLLKSLLTELLRNAWRFSASCPQVSVEVSGSRLARGVRLTVRDAGIGFDMAFADKLFEPFQRLHGVEQGAGHGIGLAVAQAVARRHAGGIHARSCPGEGATFEVELQDLDLAGAEG